MYARFKLMLILSALMGLSLQASAEEDSYVKVEIKGRFRSKLAGSAGHNGPIVEVKSEHIEVTLRPDLPRKGEIRISKKDQDELDKEIKRLDGKLVLIKGELFLPERKRARVDVSKITIILEETK